MDSVYHEGEVYVQELMGVRDLANSLSSMFQNTLSPVAIQFLKSINFSILSFNIDNKELFSCVVYGLESFIKIVNLDEILISLDKKSFIPKHIINHENLSIGFLGLDFENKMRIRINGKGKIQDNNLHFKIKQVYSNCPKYIEARKLIGKKEFQKNTAIYNYSEFNQKSEDIIKNANTFFLSSCHIIRGADVSHKGGYQGFLKVVGPSKLEFDDFAGNNMYNSLGNIHINPQVNIVVIDFDKNDILHIQGMAIITEYLEMGEKKLKVVIECKDIRVETNSFELKYDR